MSIILDSEAQFKVKLFVSLEWLYPDKVDYIFTPKYCSYDLIVRDKKQFTQVYIEHKERNLQYFSVIQTHGLMFNRCKLNYYRKYLSGSLVIIATTIQDKCYWTVYEPSMHQLSTVELNQAVVFLPFPIFCDDIDQLALKISCYFKT